MGYGDVYGAYYGSLATDSGDSTISATTSGTDEAIAEETGSVQANTTFIFPRSAVYGQTYGESYGKVNTAFADESGSATSTLTVDGTDTGIAEETGALASEISIAADVDVVVSPVVSLSAEATIRYTPLVVTASDDPVTAFKEIFKNIKSDYYTLTTPDIFKLWESSPKQRFNVNHPTVYIFSSLGDLNRFSADGNITEDSRTIDILVVTMREEETHRLTEDIIDIVGNYVDDNTNLTIFEDIDPTSVTDNRSGHMNTFDNAYVNSIEVETARLRPTG